MSEDIRYEAIDFEQHKKLLDALNKSLGPNVSPSSRHIWSVVLGIGNFLVRKNAAYGDSALDPVRIFSRASTEEQILVRLDDKLSRLKRGSAAGEDVILDLAGYLILLMVARSKA